MSLLEPLIDPGHGHPAAPGSAAQQTTARLGWRSTGQIPAMVAVCAASVAVVVETWHYFQGTPLDLQLGRIPLSPSVVPVLIMVAVCGRRFVGRPRSRQSAGVFWCLVIMVIVVATVSVEAISVTGSAGLVLAALSEELVYRVAGPLVVAFGLARLGMPYRRALTAGYVVAGVSFLSLPGHVDQMGGVTDLLPFIAFTVLATLAVHRSGAVLEIGLLHCAVNLVNIGRMTGTIGGGDGALLVGALLALLVVGYIPAGGVQQAPDTDPDVDRDVVIDLTGKDPVVVVDGHARTTRVLRHAPSRSLPSEAPH